MKMAGYASDFEWNSTSWTLTTEQAHSGSKSFRSTAAGISVLGKNTTVSSALDQRMVLYYWHPNTTTLQTRAFLLFRISQFPTNPTDYLVYLKRGAGDYTSYHIVKRVNGSSSTLTSGSISGVYPQQWLKMDARVRDSGGVAYLELSVYDESSNQIIHAIASDTSPLSAGLFGIGVSYSEDPYYAYIDDLEYYVLG